MRITLFMPMAISAVLALTAHYAGQRLPPRLAAWLLTAAAVVTGGGWAAALGMLAFTLIGRFPELAEEGGWSSGVLTAETPVNWPVAACCAVLLVACAVMLVIAAARHTRTLVRARQESRRLPVGGDLAVVDDPVPIAFALPGSPGRIVVSSSMLRALGTDERRALFAHERAHLSHRHHLFLLVVQLAAAVNPLLRPLATEVGFALERWADENAAAVVGDRPLVARAVARAALAANRGAQPALAVTGGQVPRRVQALLIPPPPLRRRLVAAHTALMIMCCASLALSAHEMDEIFDMASPAHTATVTRVDPPTHRQPESKDNDTITVSR